MPRRTLIFSIAVAISSASTWARAEDEVPEEVTVVGRKSSPVAPAAQTMDRSEIRLLPGAFGDPFRAIEALPGVVPIFSGLPYFYVRGAPPSNVGYYVDGVRVPYLFHFGLGPGVIPPAIVDRVDLYAGAYPAAWGRYAGAIVNGVTVAPRDQPFATMQARLFDAGAVFEVPFAEGRGHVLAGGRYSYTAALLSLVADDILLDYRDYTARVTYDITPRDHLTLFALGAYDLAGQTKDGERRIVFASEYHRLDARWDRSWSDRTSSRVALTFGYDRSRLEGLRFVRDTLMGLRGRMTHVVSPALAVRVGVDVNVDRYSGDPPNPYSVSRGEYAQSVDFFASRYDTQSGVHADVVISLLGKIEIVPGVRLDVFTSKGEHAVGFDPRLSAIVPIARGTRLVFAEGIAHQTYAFAIPVPAFNLPALPGGLQAAYQTSAGIEVELPRHVFASASAFHHRYRNMHDLFATSGPSDDAFSRPSALSGEAIGLELLVRRSFTERIGGLLSYTLSRNTRNAGRKDIVNGFDRTHVLNAAITGDLGKGFRIGGRVLLYSGVPRIERTISEAQGIEARTTTPDRLPAFARLDLRAEKRFTTAQGWFSIVLEGLNVTLSKESLGYSCKDGACKPEDFGPITIPSLGFEGGF